MACTSFSPTTQNPSREKCVSCTHTHRCRPAHWLCPRPDEKSCPFSPPLYRMRFPPMRCGSTCAAHMEQTCRTCDEDRTGSGGREGTMRHAKLRRGNGRDCGHRCRLPTTAAPQAICRTSRSTSGGWDDHDRGGGVRASLERPHSPGRHGMRVGSEYRPKGQRTREAAPRRH